MKGEVLVEEGVVLSVENGIAEISLTKSDNCEECSARLICKPNKDSSKILKAADPFGVIPGDTVRIEIQGKTLFNASILLYGVPLVLLVIGILLGLSIFSNYHPT